MKCNKTTLSGVAKMEQVEAAACLGLLEFLKSKHSELYGIFAGSAMDTLDPTMQLAYQEVISQPRDLETIRAKIKQGFYHTMDDFKADVHLCFDNSQLFCGMYPQFKHVVDLAKKTKDIFNKKYTTEAKAAARKVTSGAGGCSAGGRSGTRAAAAARPSIHGHEATILEKIIKPIRNEPGCALLLHPVPKSAPFYEHYSMRISHPMDFDTLQANVMSTAAGGPGASKALGFGSNDKVDATAQYEHVDEFVRDARRIFSNAIRYNCYLDKSSTALRRTFTSLLYKFEARLLEWNRKNFPHDAILPPTPPLKLCLSAIEGAFQTLTCNPNASIEVPVSAVGSFIDPVSVQLDKDTLKAYLGAVGTPMDFGTIIEKLVGGLYPTTAAFTSDVQQVRLNCVTYWSGREAEGGGLYMQDAQAVENCVNSLINTNPQRLGDMPELPKVTVQDSFVEGVDELYGYGNGGGGARGRASLGSSSAATAAAAGGGADKDRRKSTGGTLKLSLSKSRGSAKEGGGGVGVGGGRKTKKQREEEEAAAAAAEAEAALLPPVPAAPPQRLSVMEQNNFWLPPEPNTKHESENQLHRRAVKYLVSMVGGCLDEVQKHYMKSPVLTGKVMTAAPFIKPVDQRAFPAYGQFLRNEQREEVNIQSINRALRADKYGTSVMGCLNDMARLRDNAHAFNPGKENVETRIMADCVYNYFAYLVKRCLTALLHSRDDGIKRKVLEQAVMSVLDEPTAQDVITYLKLVDDEYRAEWEAKQEMELKKREALQKLLEEQAALDAENAAREQEAAMHQFLQDQAAMGPSYADQLDWGIDMAVDPYSNSFPGKGGGGKGKGGKGREQFVHEKTGWELSASSILQKIQRHMWVDLSRPDKAISDFFHPVVDMFPQIAEVYNALIDNPMDLSLLANQLNTGTILDAEEFYEKLSSIFSNLVTYNSRDGLQDHEKFAAGQMVLKGSHMVDYVKWLCVESLPVKSQEIEEKSEKPEMLGDLRHSQVAVERARREEVLKKAPLTGSAADCKKLLSALRRTKGKPEAIAMSWFCVPPVQPSDYAVYVRRPMDLGTIATRLEKGGNSAATGGFMTYGEFLGDCRLTFQNSIKYNGVHLADEGSATVHKAAVAFLQKLEDLLPSWTVEAAEKCQRDSISASAAEKRQRETYARLLEEKEKMEEFAHQELQRRLAEDAAFREDMDVEKKKQRTAEEKKAQDLEQALAGPDALERLEEAAAAEREATLDGTANSTTSGGGGDEEDDPDHLSNAASSSSGGAAGVAAAASASMLPAFLHAVSSLRLQGTGYGGVVPPYLLASAKRKNDLREAAWDAWEPTRQYGLGQKQQQQGADLDVGGYSSGADAVADEEGDVPGKRKRSPDHASFSSATSLPFSAEAQTASAAAAAEAAARLESSSSSSSTTPLVREREKVAAAAAPQQWMRAVLQPESDSAVAAASWLGALHLTMAPAGGTNSNSNSKSNGGCSSGNTRLVVNENMFL